MEYVLSPSRIDDIAQAVVDAYKKEFNTDEVDKMERAIKRIDADLNTLVDTLLDTPKAARHRIYEKMELLEAQKQEMGIEMAKLKVAAGIKYSKAEVKAWLSHFCKGDPLDEDFSSRIIDVFINSVYLYDDKIVIFYNIKNGQQVSFVGLCESLEDSSSDLIPFGGP